MKYLHRKVRNNRLMHWTTKRLHIVYSSIDSQYGRSRKIEISVRTPR